MAKKAAVIKHLRCPSEYAEGMRMMRDLKRVCPMAFEHIYKIPNEGKRSDEERLRLSAEGLKAGMPDYHLPIAIHPYHGLYIELKALDGNLSGHQFSKLLSLQALGHACKVAWGSGDAVETILNYLKGIELEKVPRLTKTRKLSC